MHAAAALSSRVRTWNHLDLAPRAKQSLSAKKAVAIWRCSNPCVRVMCFLFLGRLCAPERCHLFRIFRNRSLEVCFMGRHKNKHRWALQILNPISVQRYHAIVDANYRLPSCRRRANDLGRSAPWLPTSKPPVSSRQHSPQPQAMLCRVCRHSQAEEGAMSQCPHHPGPGSFSGAGTLVDICGCLPTPCWRNQALSAKSRFQVRAKVPVAAR